MGACVWMGECVRVCGWVCVWKDECVRVCGESDVAACVNVLDYARVC